MSVLKAPPKLIRNSTIQVRVEEEVDLKLRKYAEFIGATPAFVVAESLKMLFNKVADFREWSAEHGEKPTVQPSEKPSTQEPAHSKANVRSMFDEARQKAASIRIVCLVRRNSQRSRTVPDGIVRYFR